VSLGSRSEVVRLCRDPRLRGFVAACGVGRGYLERSAARGETLAGEFGRSRLMGATHHAHLGAWGLGCEDLSKTCERGDLK
jgi:hypothetical protein